MIYQIALSVALLILAFTTLPRTQPDPRQPAPGQQRIEQQPAVRPIDAGEPRAIDIRLVDPPLNEIAQWLSVNFDLPYVEDPPRVQRVPSAQLYRLRYKGLLPPLASRAIGGEQATPLPDYRRELVAVYDDSARTIYLREEWTGATVTEQSVVVHEMCITCKISPA